MRNRVSVGAKFAHEIRQQREGIGKGRKLGDLAADMHVDAGNMQARQLRGMAIDLTRAADRDAELVFGFAGRDLGMGPGIDIRIDPDRNIDFARLAVSDLRQQFQFGLGFDIHAQNVFVDRERKFGRGLADAGEHDLLWRNAGGAHAAQLAARHHVGAGAEPRQRRDHRLVGIGLDRVADERRHVGKGFREDPVMPLQCRRRIAIERRADTAGERGKVYRLGVQSAVAIGKVMHRKLG